MMLVYHALTAAPLPLAAQFNEGMGPILLDDLHCNGDEMSLLECPHRGIGNHNCRHFEDAGVICSNGNWDIILVYIMLKQCGPIISVITTLEC